MPAGNGSVNEWTKRHPDAFGLIVALLIVGAGVLLGVLL